MSFISAALIDLFVTVNFFSDRLLKKLFLPDPSFCVHEHICTEKDLHIPTHFPYFLRYKGRISLHFDIFESGCVLYLR